MENNHTQPNPGADESQSVEENPVPVDTNVTEPSETASPAIDGARESELPPVEPESLPIPEEKTEEHEEELTEEVAEHEAREAQVDFDHFTREQLVEELEKVVSEPDISAIKTRIALIKVAFLKKGKELHLDKLQHLAQEQGTPEVKETEHDDLDRKFDAIFDIYKTRKAKYTEEQEHLKHDNLKRKMQILDELKQLISSEETLKKTYDEFKTLQDRWKEVGMVPRTEINNLWQNYHFLVEKFFEKVKLNKELKDLDLRKNLEAKMALCEKTEELLLEPSIIKSFKKLQQYHEEWKEIGPVPTDKKDEIWERFRMATEKINERRREYYTRIQEEQQKNLETKSALCEQAEEMLSLKNESIKEWQENTSKINELLNIWKSVGPVPQKVNNEIWKRFKNYLDSFFVSKKEYFDKLKEQQLTNYNMKVELCVQAEALKNNTDWKKTTNDLIRLQNDWKKIGPVPKKHSDRIWKRFRSACDEFFAAKSHYYSNLQSVEEENLKKKQELLERLKSHEFGDDKTANLEALKNFQREWTEIGHIPIKEKDKLQNDFRAVINQHLDKLKISELEISTMNYQNKFEHLKGDPQARRIIFREKEILTGKINKLRDDINLWENNIGFLAKTKNAAILREEFDKKIQKAKNELSILEAKLKILRKQAG